MNISKIIIAGYIINLIYKFIKKRNLNKEENNYIDEELIFEKKSIKKNNRKYNNEYNKNEYNKNEYNNKNEDNKYALVIYKHKKKSNYNLKDVYDNFFNEKKKNLKKGKIDQNILNTFNYKKNEDVIIFSEKKNNIILNNIDNFLIFNFDVKENNFYKIKCYLNGININNIKLIMSNENKRFIYDCSELNDNDNISTFEFILDNNNFENNENISLYLMFYNDNDNNMIINNLNIEIIEKNKNNNNCIIIFNIDEIYNPMYINENNILDYKEYNDESSVFFI